MKNIVIIGMPGVGKTSVARAISRVANIPVVDIDETIEKNEGPIPAIFEKLGEAGFRAIEKETVRRAAERKGVVIATGGGSVLDPENVARLKINGALYWIRRPLNQLAREGRPLSAGGIEAVEALWEARKALYADAADAVLKNDAIEETARAIWAIHREGEKR